MANSTLKFYKVAFPSDTNVLVDDLDMYLDGLNAIVIEDYQYLRPELEMSIKVNFEQSQIDNFDYNYMSMQNDNEDIHYFYIANKSQIAQHTMKLVLALDTVNTLGARNSLCNPRNFNSTTQIKRQHMDRFYKPTSFNPHAGAWLWRKIDKETEGVVPDKIKAQDTAIRDNQADFDWYLIYRSDSEAETGVETLLCASEEIQVGQETVAPSVTYTVSDFDIGTYYYFSDIDNPNGAYTCVTTNSGAYSVKFGETTITGLSAIEANYNAGTQYMTYTPKYNRTRPRRMLVLYRESSTVLKYYEWRNDQVNATNTGSGTVGNKTIGINVDRNFMECTSITFTQANFFRTSTTNHADQTPEGLKYLVSSTKGIYVGSTTTQTLSSINDIDRKDSKLVKIIKCPYCPIAYTKNTRNVFNFGEDWTYSLGFMRYNKDNLPSFINDSNLSFSLSPQTRYFLSADQASYIGSKNINLESKLYHSDFETVKMVYDTFTKDVKLENIAINTTNPNTTPVIPIVFKPTSTINSKFGFKFDIKNTNLGTYRADQDFDNILLTSRNNEETILNNEYINYIKYGKEIDLKQNALTVEQSKRQATATTVGTSVAELAALLGLIFGGPTVKVGSAIALGAGAITGGVSTANAWQNVSDTESRLASALESKLSQLNAQSASTAGTDDVDLMSWYSDNRLHMMRYEPNDPTRFRLWKAMDFTGYSHNAFEIPAVDSRIWYNYIQCTPAIDFEGTKNLNSAWINDLKSKYEQGITVFHHHNLGGQYDTWSFDRRYENYETWMLGE